MICSVRIAAQRLREGIALPLLRMGKPEAGGRKPKEKIAFIYRKAAELFHLPERLVKKICHWLLVIAGAVLAVYLLLLIGKSAIASHHADNSYQIQQENLAKLESYYQAGEFEEMRDYLYDIDGYYRATYSKYYIIGNIAETLASTRKSLKSIMNIKPSI